MEAPLYTTQDTRVFDPSNTIMFADAAMPQPGDLIEYGLIWPPYSVSPENPTGDPDDTVNVAWEMAPSIHFRHNQRANVVWCDGHISSEPWGWAHGQFNVYNGNNYQWGVGWFGPKDNSLFYHGPKSDFATTP